MGSRSVQRRTRPPVAIAHRPLDPRTVRLWTRAVDAGLMSAAAVLLVAVAFDAVGPVRSLLAVVIAVVVPGWTLCRWWGWAFSASMLLTSLASSVAVTIVVGQVAVTRTHWPLESVGAGLASVCLVGLALLHLTRRAHV